MVDLRKIIKENKLYNFHSHTQFCDGKDEMSKFVEEAVIQGFSHYGFSPHSPLPIESPCNMSFDNVDAYLKIVDDLKEKFGNTINIYKSMEIDYIDNQWGPNNKYFNDLNLDYKIGSVHFIPTQEGEFVDIDGRFSNFKIKMDKYFDNDINYVVKTFYNETIKMIEEGNFDVISSFEIIAHNSSVCNIYF